MSNKEERGSLNQGVLSDIIDFLSMHPEADYRALSQFVKSKGIDFYDMDFALTVLAKSYVGFVYGGKFADSDLSVSDIDSAELSRGEEIETEHTSNKFIARRIALDHLVEIKDYYTRLDKMESEAKK